MATTIPDGYRAKLGLYETQSAISLIKRTFQDALAAVLNLERVSAPLFVKPSDGLNDDLNGYERPVRFDIPAAEVEAEVVHSLAKWKRYALHRYGFKPGSGLYTDMNAIRRDEALDNLHSVYVDQWDWEKVITREERNEALLKRTVRAIVDAIGYTLTVVQARYPELTLSLNRDVAFVTSEELIALYPAGPPASASSCSCASMAPHSSCRSAAACPTVSRMMVARPIMTTGRSTAISCSIIPCSTARWKSPAWASAWMRRPSPHSSNSPVARRAPRCRSIARCSAASCR